MNWLFESNKVLAVSRTYSLVICTKFLCLRTQQEVISPEVSVYCHLSEPLLMEKSLRLTFSAATSVIWGHAATLVASWRIRTRTTVSTGLSNAIIDGYFAVFPRIPSWACAAVRLDAIHADPVILAGISSAVIIINLAVLTTVSLWALAQVAV